jgi:alanyl-tRNA synthetase
MRHIHILGAKEPMMYKLVGALVKEMGDAYPELKRAEPVIISTLKFEEERFRDTLDRGLKLLNSSTESMNSGSTLPGDIAFKLYDTYGFPLDLTKDILKSKNIQVDDQGFEQQMQEQKKRARAAWVGSGEQASEEVWFDIHEQVGATEFLGYMADEAEAVVRAIVVNGKPVEKVASGQAIVILNQTPFYAESGGQVGDTGYLNEHEVIDTKKYASTLYGHIVNINKEIKVGDTVHAKIDVERRSKVRANHSATHLLHKVLRKQLGEHVTQKGSIVTAEKLRFDFSHPQGLTAEQIASVENVVNNMIVHNNEVLTEILTPEQAIAKGAMALFGEKYGDEVRTVGMGESLELCGGTHVARTGDIGLFKIVAEEAIAAGVRRIEALTGLEALYYVRSKEEIIKNLAIQLKCADNEVQNRIQSLIDEKRKAEKDIAALRVSLALSSETKAETLGEIELLIKKLDSIPPQDLRTIALELLKKHQNGIVVLTTVVDNRVSMLVAVSNSLINKYNAQELIKEAAKHIEGNGGGKSDMAQAGGSNIKGIDIAIESIKKHISVK